MLSPQKIILPVKYPMITTYTQHAHLLSILSNHEETYPWIMSNYIQLYTNKDYKYNWSDFYFPLPYELRPSDTCKWIHTQKIHKDRISSEWGSIIDFIIDSINNNNYLNIMVDCYFISQYNDYKKHHQIHESFIFGYDYTQKIFFSSDFFNKNGYQYKEIPFSEYQKAFMSYTELNTYDFLNGMVYTFEFNPGYRYVFCFDNIVNAIHAYLAGAPPEYWEMYNQYNLYWDMNNCPNKNNIVFGREIYNSLNNYLESVKNSDASEIIILPFYLLYDHKRLMSLRIDFLNKSGFLKKKNSKNEIFSQIENEVNIIMNLIIKYSFVKKKAIIEKIQNKLNEINKIEFDALNDIFG